MSQDILHIKSISQVHEAFDFNKPTHPLISVIDVAQLEFDKDFVGNKYSSELYTIAMKDASCGMQYGRNTYDFEEGILIFTAPNQVLTSTKPQAKGDVQGWMLFFHPDLIRNTHLGRSIDDFSFFSYDVYEALHLSEHEQETITDCIKKIQQETEGRIDNMSQRVIVSNLELLLNYCMRFYQRQFNTRTATHKDTVTKVNDYLKTYFKNGQLAEFGAPSVQKIADSVNLSPSYLTDLLKKETGRSAKDHINDFIVDKAKDLLLSSQQSVSEIAYNLGFNYPHYFSRLFKAKTGISPNQYRSLN